MTTYTLHRNRRGFALPFTIFLVTFITLILAAAFARTAAEHLVAQSTEDHVTVQSIAESGLHAFFHDSIATRPASGDSIRYNVQGGYAWVFTDELRKPADTIADDITYVIRSTGYLIEQNQGSVPQAQMTVSQFARWRIVTDPTILGAFTTADRLRVRPNGTVAIYGSPSCGGSGPIPSIRAAAGGLMGAGNVDSTSGLAPLVQDPDAVVAAATGVTWATIDAGNYEAD